MKRNKVDIHRMRKILAVMVIALSGAFVMPVLNAMPSEMGTPHAEMTAQPAVRVVSGHVEITLPGDEPRDVAVYALTGQLVKTLSVQPGTTVIELPAGYYIVKCDRLSQRVIIR